MKHSIKFDDMFVHIALIFQAVKCSDVLVKKLDAQNRRSLDQLSAKAYFYHSRAYELIGKLDQIRR